MTAVAALGAFMSSTGVVAIFILVALRIAQATGTVPSRLMMPLSVAVLISGMLTLVATASTLVVNSVLERYKLADRQYRLRVTDRSWLVGKTLAELDLRDTSGANIVAIERNRRFSFGDFVRISVPFSVIVTVVSVLL